MRSVFTLLRKDLACFFNDRAAVAMTFLVPSILIYIFGFVFGFNKSSSPAPSGIVIAVVNRSSDAVAKDLVDALKAEKAFRVRETRKNAEGASVPLTEDDVRAAVKNNEYRYAIVLPEDLLSDEGFGVHMKFISNPRNDIEMQMVNGILQKTIFSNVPQLLGKSLVKSGRSFIGAERYDRFSENMADLVSGAFGADKEELLKQMKEGQFFPREMDRIASNKKPIEPGLRRLDTGSASPADAEKMEKTDGKNKEDDLGELFSRIVRIEKEQVIGKQVKNPMAARVVGGYAIMFLLFAVSAASISLFDEKKNGIIQRLLSTPITRSHILGAKFLYGTVFGMLQLLTLFLVGHLLYDLDLFRNLIPLLVVSLFAATTCSAFGMFVAAIAPTAMAAHGVNTLLVLTMSSIGGAWFPVSFMPEFIQNISRFTLVYWSVEGFTSVLWAGQGVMELLPTIGMLCLMTVVILSVALWRFSMGRLFD